MESLTDIEKVFMLSKANGQDNCQDMLPVNGWTWPADTWLKRRIEQLKEGPTDDNL